MQENEDYPAKNRRPALDLGVVESRIVSANGSTVLDANNLLFSVAKGSLELGTPTTRPSDISGAPGYVYQTTEIELVLTKPELLRLISRALEPKEFMALRDAFGDFYEIHDDFYDEFTGEALQPFLTA